ncbi:serine/threonine-protein kinase [Streptomyces mirabilis]|uniref:serine/threonine-protein kinase n=1 Tax=Streptomyces TaxID=1883 RepID=UPI000BD35AC3|nr:serine/threonine-protein kinase [Streptomyces sp. OK228]SOE24808.1 Serine/threonine protein kinase [Streptomyces sp. OK228]
MRFGAWVVEGELGRGGMGVVYAAVHSESGERRALKVIHAPAGADEEVARFSREVRVCMALHHPHVVCVMGVERTGPENGALPMEAEPCCLILELCEGGSLADRVRRDGPLPVRQALEFFDGVLAGLGHVHQEHGFVHRDIKPHNILLAFGSDGRTTAKLADFGLAKAYDSAGLSGLTRTGAVMGTPAFMPRAQLINYKYATPEVDVWSTAASLYHVLTGSTPRDLPPGWDPWLAVATSPVVPVGKRGVSLPPGLGEVLDHALSDEPDGGFQTAEALRAALNGS